MAGDGNSYIRVKWNLGRSYFIDCGPLRHTAYAGLRNWVKFVSRNKLMLSICLTLPLFLPSMHHKYYYLLKYGICHLLPVHLQM